MRTLGVCLFLLLAVGVGFCSDHSSDGNQLLVLCQMSVKEMDTGDYRFAANQVVAAVQDGICIGLVKGVSDVSPHVCPPKDAPYGQEIRIVVRYLENHPEELHLRDTALIEKALSQAFPCH